MALLTIIFFNLMFLCEVMPGLLDREEYLKVLQVAKKTAPDFYVAEVYKRQCCGFQKAVEKFPLKSGSDNNWARVKTWKHKDKKNTQNQPFIMDCFKFQTRNDLYLARILSANIIMIELRVTNCEKVPNIVKIKGNSHNYANKRDYIHICVDRVKYPRQNPSQLSDGIIEGNSSSHEAFAATKRDNREDYKCVNFQVSEKDDVEEDCERGIQFDSREWIENS